MLLKIAWRNVWRNKSRSLIVISSIVVGVWALVAGTGFMNGFMVSYISDAINHNTSNIQIHNTEFSADKDIKFFESEFGGIMPLEILIDTKKEKGVMKLSTLKKMEKINETIETFPELSKPISVTNLVKYSKQAYYRGNPKYYQLPTSQEQSYIFAYTKKGEELFDAVEYLFNNHLSKDFQKDDVQLGHSYFLGDENGLEMRLDYEIKPIFKI